MTSLRLIRLCQCGQVNTIYSFIKTHLKQKTIIFLSTCKQVRYYHEVFCRLRPGVPLLALQGKQKQMKRLAIFTKFADSQAHDYSPGPPAPCPCPSPPLGTNRPRCSSPPILRPGGSIFPPSTGSSKQTARTTSRLTSTGRAGPHGSTPTARHCWCWRRPR